MQKNIIDFKNKFLDIQGEFYELVGAGKADLRFREKSKSSNPIENFKLAIQSVPGVRILSIFPPGKYAGKGLPGPKSGMYHTFEIEAGGPGLIYIVLTSKIKTPTVYDEIGIPIYSGGAEERQINAMNAALSAIVKERGAGINLMIGKNLVPNVGAIISVEGTPKADAYLAPLVNGKIDTRQKLAWVSLKNASSPNEMNQWSGVTDLLDNIQVQEFVKNIKIYLDSIGQPNTMLQKQAFKFSQPLDKDLAFLACYGKGPRGTKNQVDMIYVCNDADVRLDIEGKDVYRFGGGFTLTEGELPFGDWEPILMARYDSGRSNAGIKNCRIGIFPKGQRSGVKNIEDLLDEVNSGIYKEGKTRKIYKETNYLRKLIRQTLLEEKGGTHTFHGNRFPTNKVGLPGPDFDDDVPVTQEDLDDAKKWLEEYKPDKIVAYSRGSAVLHQLAKSYPDIVLPEITYVTPAAKRDKWGTKGIKAPSVSGRAIASSGDGAVPVKQVCSIGKEAGIPVYVVPGEYKSDNWKEEGIKNHIRALKYKGETSPGKQIDVDKCLNSDLPDWGTGIADEETLKKQQKIVDDITESVIRRLLVKAKNVVLESSYEDERLARLENWLVDNIFDSPRPVVKFVNQTWRSRGAYGSRFQNFSNSIIRIEHPSLDEGYLEIPVNEVAEVFGLPKHLRNYIVHRF